MFELDTQQTEPGCAPSHPTSNLHVNPAVEIQRILHGMWTWGNRGELREYY